MVFGGRTGTPDGAILVAEPELGVDFRWPKRPPRLVEREIRLDYASVHAVSEEAGDAGEQSLVPARGVVGGHDHDRQPSVFLDVVRQAAAGRDRVEAL